jgi:DNA-binding MarR family transcriptional regulator
MPKFETERIPPEADSSSAYVTDDHAGPPIADRDFSVLRLIGEEDLTGFTFDGLKRRLQAHSETLSRTLNRLESDGIIEKGEYGYRVTPKGREHAALRPLSAPEERLTLLRTLLPNDNTPGEVIKSLKGRWFGNLRWLGYSEGADGVSLKWVTEDGGVQVEARFLSDELLVEGKLHDGKNLTDAIRASHQLMGFIARASAKSTPFRRMALMRVQYSYYLPN